MHSTTLQGRGTIQITMAVLTRPLLPSTSANQTALAALQEAKLRALIAAEDPSLKGKDKEMDKDLQWKMLVKSMRLEEEKLKGLGVLCPSPSIF